MPAPFSTTYLPYNLIITLFEIFSLKIIATWIGSRQISMEPIHMFFYKLRRNFAISFAVELLVAQPIARLVMVKIHQAKDQTGLPGQQALFVERR